MEVLGFSGEDQDSIFRILASILHLGNVYFEKYEVRECHSLLWVPSSLGTWAPFQRPKNYLDFFSGYTKHILLALPHSLWGY